MNIVCSNCSTKYSLADERVADGVYHTPCKRCGATMVIHKQAMGESAAASRPATLRSQRSEDSLLFSLGNLATTADRLTPITGPESTDRVRAEDSGLLDIRRMAASYQGEGQARPSASSSDLFAPMAAPVPLLSPVVTARSSKKSPLWWLVGGATGMAVATLVLAVMVLKGDLSGNNAQASTTRPGVANEPSTPTLLATALPAEVEPTTTVAPVVAPVEPEPVAPAPVTKAAKPEVETKPRTRERSRTRPREQRTNVERNEQPAPPETAPPKKGCLDEVACLLATDPPACCRKYTTTKPEPEVTDKPDPRLPKKLDRAAIKASMGKSLARVTACGSRSSASGKVTVSIKVSGDGSVARVTVKEAPDSALGKCVAKAVEKATFPKTQQGGSFAYPFLF